MQAMLNTNLAAMIDCTQAVLPTMLQQKSGHIINSASLAGLIALPCSSAYCASKSGVFGFSDSLRRELRGTGVRVSTFCPGYTPSELTSGLKAHAEGKPDAPRLLGLMPTAYVADQLARLAYHPRRLVILPKSWRILVLVDYLFPGLVDRVLDKNRPPP
jgi:short-subunit dehydrogenase